MPDSALFRRNAASVSLISSAVLGAASAFLYQPTAHDPAGTLAALHQNPGRATASAILFVLYGLPAMIGALGIAHLLRERFPRLSSIGVSLAVLGAFADSVAGTFTVVYTVMAKDSAHSDVFATVITSAGKIEGLFSLVGLIGSVVGTLLLTIGLFRASVGPRWVPPMLWAFLVLEFAGSGALPLLGLAAVTLGVIAYGALALYMRSTPRSDWATASSPAARVPAPAL